MVTSPGTGPLEKGDKEKKKKRIGEKTIRSMDDRIIKLIPIPKTTRVHKLKS